MKVGLVQLCSTMDIPDNLRRIEAHVADAAAQGARWVLLPENAPFLGKDGTKPRIAEPLDGPIVQRLQDLARAYSIWLTVGSVPEASNDPSRTYNTQLHIDPSGTIQAVYRKIHLFDVEAGGVSYQESLAILPGDTLVTTTVNAPTHDGSGEDEMLTVGLSICYDLRFPELYRALVTDGAQVLTVPAAFTIPTGQAHWHALLRARAIENQCFVLAPDQTGEHVPGRASFGHTVAYDPWGRQLGVLEDGEGVLVVDLDLAEQRRIRATMPCLQHRTL